MSSTYSGDPANNPTSITIPSDGDAISAASVNTPLEGLMDKIVRTQATIAAATVQNFRRIETDAAGIFDAATFPQDMIFNIAGNAWHGVTNKAEYLITADGAERFTGTVGITNAVAAATSLMAAWPDDGSADAGRTCWGAIGTATAPGVFTRSLAGSYTFTKGNDMTGSKPSNFHASNDSVGGVVRVFDRAGTTGIWVAYLDAQAADTSGSVGICTSTSDGATWTWRVISGTHAGAYAIGSRPRLYLACPNQHAEASQIIAASTTTSASCLISSDGTTWTTESFGWSGASPAVAGLCWCDDGYFYALANVTGGNELRRRLPEETTWTLISTTFDGGLTASLRDLRSLDGGILVAKVDGAWSSTTPDQGRLWFSFDGGSTWYRGSYGNVKGAATGTLGSSDSGRMSICGGQYAALPLVTGLQHRGRW